MFVIFSKTIIRQEVYYITFMEKEEIIERLKKYGHLEIKEVEEAVNDAIKLSKIYLKYKIAEINNIAT